MTCCWCCRWLVALVLLNRSRSIPLNSFLLLLKIGCVELLDLRLRPGSVRWLRVLCLPAVSLCRFRLLHVYAFANELYVFIQKIDSLAQFLEGNRKVIDGIVVGISNLVHY